MGKWEGWFWVLECFDIGNNNNNTFGKIGTWCKKKKVITIQYARRIPLSRSSVARQVAKRYLFNWLFGAGLRWGCEEGDGVDAVAGYFLNSPMPSELVICTCTYQVECERENQGVVRLASSLSSFHRDIFFFVDRRYKIYAARSSLHVNATNRRQRPFLSSQFSLRGFSQGLLWSIKFFSHSRLFPIDYFAN